MKYRLVITLVSLLSILYSCEKSWFDYRNKYCGNWEFTTILYSWNGPLGPGSLLDISSYSGIVDYGFNKNELLINYAEDSIITVRIERDGEIPETDGYSGSFTGKESVNISKEYYKESHSSCSIIIEGEKN